MTGPSPRVRGNPSASTSADDQAEWGSIPACAGKPRRASTAPRSEQRDRSIPACAGKPSSRRRVACRSAFRSIPACAGKPKAAHGLSLDFRGGGPSPRVRGNRLHHATWKGRAASGSIPACAGKPHRSVARVTLFGTPRVHPRVCGETLRRDRQADPVAGPSPRVRGNPSSWHQSLLSRGSIPACAGKPCRCRSASTGIRVHPRVCGETLRSAVRLHLPTGPSPRVRGNRLRPLPIEGGFGSIPRVRGNRADLH